MCITGSEPQLSGVVRAARYIMLKGCVLGRDLRRAGLTMSGLYLLVPSPDRGLGLQQEHA